MAAALTLGLLFALIYWACRQRREASAQQMDPDDLDVERLRRDMARAVRREIPVDDPRDWRPGAAAASTGMADEREAALSRELLAGTIPPAIYQQQMADLAGQRDPTAGSR